MRYDYNPFDKDFEQITSTDLGILTSVAEGWYVEYKREVPNASAIAKSVTAFANTYGGWLFYGITEDSKDNPVAGSSLGIPSDEADGALQRIRQAVANHSQPSPYFRAKALFGPIEELGLPEGRCIVVTQIPWGPEAPFIHKDGRIYRRVGDGSEPRPETDRFILDQLWKRSSGVTRKYNEWVEREIENSEAEEHAAYARIFLISDFWQDHPPRKSVSLRQVREIMSREDCSVSIPFDNVYQTVGGFICRQTADNDPEMLGLTWKLGRDFRSEITIPLSKARKDLVGHNSWLNGYKYAPQFLSLCRAQRYDRPNIIDLNMLLYVLLGLARTHAALAEEFSWRGPVYAKIEITGVWRTIPFFDAPHVLDEYERHGMPLGLRDRIVLYSGEEQENYIELPGPDEDTDAEQFRLLTAYRLFVAIAVALGVPTGIDEEGDGSDFPGSLSSFLDAGRRALEVQKSRATVTDPDY
ncbi:AlbA family DNA-binding domain-containing protein [Pseudorhizobium flavum]|uniref:AlbA family DNA-binding domain-containing protein n=1 Tax=Pseudorhizobium flavum TaxID=1335061 RepID=UPI00377031FF